MDWGALMSRVRLRFAKGGNLSFIGHLDFLRVFQQTIRRAELPAAYSLGFNPHLHLSFALPLPLGMESVNDYADLTLEKTLPEEEILESLNTHAPRGLKIHAVYPVENKAASIVSIAEYRLLVSSDIKKNVQTLLDSAEIKIMKKTKSGIKETDIRPDIIKLTAEQDKVSMFLSAGSSRFLHPMTVAELILGEKPSPADICRVELFTAELKPL